MTFRNVRNLLIAAIAFPLALAIMPVEAASPQTIRLLTAPLGTGSYVLGTALEKISTEAKGDIRVSSSQSPGFIYNLKKITRDRQAQKDTVIGSGAGLLSLAVNGQPPFKRKYAPLKLIANYVVEGTWLATLDPNIKSGQDLVGKRIALGRTAQINWAVEPREIIQYGWGIPLSKLHIQYVGIKQGANALLNGTVDAAIVGAYFNPATGKVVASPQTLELMSSGRKVHFIPWGKAAVEKTAQHGLAIRPYELPAGSMDGVDKPLEIFADNTAWMVSANFPANAAYALSKMIINNVTRFGSFNATGKLMTKQMLTAGWKDSEIASGALKAYREAGLVK